ncbi:MAG: M81 family metallopeptidase [Verrucomicrobia bacterium]|nr:M81 family metallopeptidase [Verrucomicrobiota bacterium]
MKKRVLVAGLFHETNTFVERRTRLADFQIARDETLLGVCGDPSPLGGALELAKEFGWEIVSTIDYRASPGGLVADAAVETFWSELREHAEPALARGVDGLFLVLHGAMVSESFLDVEGEILRRFRALPGADRLPIFGVFDLHANFTATMATHANCLVAYRENPHTDARESAQRAARLLERCFRSGEIPKMFSAHPPIIWPPTGTATATEPMRELEQLAREVERESSSFWAVNVVPGFSFADTPDTGVSFSIVTTGSAAAAEQALDRLCAAAIKHRELGCVAERPVDDVLRELSPLPAGLTVLAEPSDNIGAGAPGDGTGLLRALVRHRVHNAAMVLCDPAAVAWLTGLPLSSSMVLDLGGRGSRLDAGPLRLEVELVSRSDGRFQLEDTRSHLASMCGQQVDMGPCAVVRHGSLTLLLTSRPTPPFDLGQWRSQGIDPAKFSVVGVKAAVAHRRAYEPIAARLLTVDTPGPCSSNLRALPYQQVRRPVWPLDEL